MSIDESVDLIFLATEKMRGQEIFVLKMLEKNIFNLAKETISKYANEKQIKIKLIGAREREKTRERLFTDEEKESMIEEKLFYVILPNKGLYKDLTIDKRFRYKS